MMDIKHECCRPAIRICGIFLLLAASAFAAEPTYKTGETIFIET
ncbi:MAG: hypothetical protein H6R21_374, partial [Proteobacteria bacterium]|nr:hypothetical protein [Pseudomonadota bacterium]